MTNNNFGTAPKSIHLTTLNVRTKHNVLTTGSDDVRALILLDCMAAIFGFYFKITGLV